MILEKDKNIALVTHLSGFGSYLFPLGSIVIPFIIRETKKDDSEFMDELTKDVVNFNLSYLLYTFAVKLLVVPMFVGSFFENIFTFHFNFEDFDTNQLFGIISFGSILSILMIIKFVLIIKASIKTHDGESYKYPYIIQFIK